MREASVHTYVQSSRTKIADAVPTKRNGKACAEDQAFIDACVEKYQVPEYYDPADIRAALHFDLAYCADQAAYFRDAQKKAMQRLDDDRSFARAEKFASGETKAQCEALRTGLTNGLLQQAQKAEQEAAAEKQRITEAYRAFLKETEPKLAAAHKEALAKWEDAQKRKEEFECLRAEQKKRAEEAEKLAGEKARKKAAKAKKLTIIGVIAAVVIIAAVLIVTKVIIPSVNYSKAETYLAAGDTAKAAITFGKISGYKDAQKRSFMLWQKIAERETLSLGSMHTVGLKTDGSVVAVGWSDEGQCNVFDWKNMIAVCTGIYHTVGLNANGTVVAVGRGTSGIFNVSSWKNIVAVCAGSCYTVGLKADGTVIATGLDVNGQCDVSDWTDIVAVSTGNGHIVGLQVDGTVVSSGENQYGQSSVSDWHDIVSISCGHHHTVGLQADGTVVAEGLNDYGQCDVSSWTDIVAISAGDYYTVGLKADGSVVAVGDNRYGQCDTSAWTDVVAIGAGYCHTACLKADGTAVAIGQNLGGQCNISGWTDIKLPNK